MPDYLGNIYFERIPMKAEIRKLAFYWDTSQACAYNLRTHCLSAISHILLPFRMNALQHFSHLPPFEQGKLNENHTGSLLPSSYCLFLGLTTQISSLPQLPASVDTNPGLHHTKSQVQSALLQGHSLTLSFDLTTVMV